MHATVRGSEGVVNNFDVFWNSMRLPSRRNAMKSLTRAAYCIIARDDAKHSVATFSADLRRSETKTVVVDLKPDRRNLFARA